MLVHCGTSVYVGSSFQKQPSHLYVAELRGDVEKCCALQFEKTRAGAAEVEFRESTMHQRAIRVEVFCEKIETAAKQVQHRRHVVLRRATCLDEKVHALPELRRTAIRADNVVQCAAGVLADLARAVGIRSVLQQPLDGRRLHRFAWCKNNWEVSVPLGVHIRSVGHKQLHHGDAKSHQRGAHQRAVTALMNVRAVRDHPLRHREPGGARRLPRYAAFRDPRERTIFVVAKRSAMQRGIARHQVFNFRQVVRINGQL